MTPLKVLLTRDAVDEYLVEHELVDGYAPIEAVLLQNHGTSGGKPAVMIIARVNGKRVLTKTTLGLLQSAVSMMTAVTEPLSNTPKGNA